MLVKNFFRLASLVGLNPPECAEINGHAVGLLPGNIDRRRASRGLLAAIRSSRTEHYVQRVDQHGIPVAAAGSSLRETGSRALDHGRCTAGHASEPTAVHPHRVGNALQGVSVADPRRLSVAEFITFSSSPLC